MMGFPGRLRDGQRLQMSGQRQTQIPHGRRRSGNSQAPSRHRRRALGTSRLPLQLVPRLAPYEKNGKNRQGSLMIQRGVQSGGGVNPTGNVRTYASAFRTDPNRSGLKSPNLQALEIRK